MAHDVALEILHSGEGLRGVLLPGGALGLGDGCWEESVLAMDFCHLSHTQTHASPTSSSPYPQPYLIRPHPYEIRNSILTFNTLDLPSTQPRHRPLVLRPRQAGRSHRSLQIRDRRASGGPSLPDRRRVGHLSCMC
jgi:hypothetical protein